jgi:hypothetical protein
MGIYKLNAGKLKKPHQITRCKDVGHHLTFRELRIQVRHRFVLWDLVLKLKGQAGFERILHHLTSVAINPLNAF